MHVNIYCMQAIYIWYVWVYNAGGIHLMYDIQSRHSRKSTATYGRTKFYEASRRESAGCMGGSMPSYTGVTSSTRQIMYGKKPENLR